MLSKEVIKTFINDVNRKKDNTIYQTSMENAQWLKDTLIDSLQYIEQLETEKQNLIEELEENLEMNNKDIELAEIGKLNLSSEEWAEVETENKLIEEILSYMKGEEK